MKHTPGPWHVERAADGINLWVGCERYTIATISHVASEVNAGEMDANATLIASASDLLKAVDRLTNAAFARDNTMGDPCALLAAQAELRDAARNARVAILAATGGTPC